MPVVGLHVHFGFGPAAMVHAVDGKSPLVVKNGNGQLHNQRQQTGQRRKTTSRACKQAGNRARHCEE